MSSPGLPRLDVEVGQRHAERWLAVASTSLATTLTGWLLAASVAMPWAVAAGLAVGGALLIGFFLAGWLGGERRIERLVWFPDGHWLLLDRDGRGREAYLGPATRLGPGCLWLRWQSAAPRSMLLLPGDLAADQLRRLLVRLRIDRQKPDQVFTRGSDLTSELP